VRNEILVTLGTLLLSLGTANAEQGKPSCRETAGVYLSHRYVMECLEVSAATHPPCNALNSCGLILSEVHRGCLSIRNSLVAHPEWGIRSPTNPVTLTLPSFCKEFR
jgi:hypothetical protein